MLARRSARMKRKAFKVVHFTNELLNDFGRQRGLKAEQEIVEALGKFLYGDNFIRCNKQRDDIINRRNRPPQMDVSYYMVFWAEKKPQ